MAGRHRPTSTRVLGALLVAWGVVSGSARAERPAPVRLDLAQAVRLAETRSPTLAPSRATLTGATGVQRAADTALPVPPRVEAQAGPRLSHDPASRGVEVTLAAWQDFSLGGYGGARRDFGLAMHDEAHAGVGVAELDAGTRAALTWVEARLSRELLTIREESLKGAEELLRVARARVAGGRAASSEEALATSLVGSARASVLDAEGRQVVSDAELRFLVGLPPDAPLELVGPLDAPGEQPNAPDVKAALSRHPDLELARAAVRRRETASEMARSGGRPFLSVGPVVTREGTGDWILQGRVAMPLPVVNPAGVEGARAQAEALTARAELGQLRASLDTRIRVALHEREHARQVRDTLRTGAIEPAREALRLAERQYGAGSAELVLVIGARRELLDAEQHWAEAAADVRRADIRLARALGKNPALVEPGGRP